MDLAGLLNRKRERAESLVHGLGTWTPPPIRNAATVCLLRTGADGPEIFLMRRNASMAFAAGMYVYPGGAVETSDSTVRLAGHVDLAELGDRMFTEDPAALLAAAARETFEECGVLLAVTADGGRVVWDDDLDVERAALAASEIEFADLLARRGLVVDDSALIPFAHWVTPAVEDRRFDTRFFVTSLPEGQEARHLGGEADRVAWWRPSAALAESAAGHLPLLTPTVAALEMLAEHTDVASALAAAALAEFAPLLPQPYVGADGEIAWRLVHARTGVTIDNLEATPPSETDGVRGIRGAAKSGLVANPPVASAAEGSQSGQMS